jgi:hypothetical protein
MDAQNLMAVDGHNSTRIAVYLYKVIGTINFSGFYCSFDLFITTPDLAHVFNVSTCNESIPFRR